MQKQNCNEVLGYLPKRGDFEQEYDMDAELLLADMEFFDDDTPENIELKNNVIELYNARLDERIRRKKFVIERGLLDLKKIQKYERKKSKEEREIINQMKIFARFNTEEQHQKLVNTLLKERLLKEVIEQLRFFKNRGLTTLDQIEKFIEAHKAKSKTNNYDKPYIGQVSASLLANQKAGAEALKKWEETQRFIKNRDELLGEQPEEFEEFASQNHLIHDEKWTALNTKEKQLCSRLNLKPTSYVKLKSHILSESVKNRAVKAAFLSDLQRKNLVPPEKRTSIPLIYEFLVQTKLIMPA